MKKLPHYIALIKDAISGKEYDYTSGNLNKAIVLLSIPMVLEVILESVFALVDIYFVSRINTNAVAVVGLTETVLTLVYSISIGVSMSATAMVARRIGEKSKVKAAVAAYQAMLLGLIVSVVLGLLGMLFAPEILKMMGATDTMISESVGYTRITFAANFSIVFLFLLNGIFRGAGNPAIAMRSLWLANGLNILLDPIFIFGLGPIPAMGIEGAAIATAVGRSVGVLYQLKILFSGSSIIHLHRRVLIFRPAILFTLVKVAIGGIGQYLINSASWIFLARIISRFGPDTIAGYTIAIRLIIFAVMPSWGIGNAASTLVGQNLGANQPERAATSVWRAAFINMLFMGTISAFFLVFARQAVGFFTTDPVVLYEGTKALRIVSMGYVLYAYGMVISMAFNGAGDTKTPTIINFICFWMIQIPLAWILASQTDLGSTSVYIAILSAESLLALIAIYWFRKGYWKATQV